MFLILVSLLVVILVNIISTRGGDADAAVSATSHPIVCEGIGWVNGNSVNLGCLLFKKSIMKYPEAESFCNQRNGHLVEILSSEQMNFVVDQMKLQQDGVNQTYWWGGATDEAKEGRWTWTGAGVEVQNFVWGEAQPDISTGRNLLCFDSKYNFLGNDCRDNDDDLKSTTYPICQRM